VFPGPIFGKELATAARGPRIYLVRSLVAAAIAGHVATRVAIPGRGAGAGFVTPGALAALANSAFLWFANSQAVVVVALVPLLVAGAVAEEKARGTLGLLLASRLTSAEIIADKLAARLLLVVVLMALGLPVVALVGLYGGVDPAEALTYYGGTLASAYFAASLSMLASVHARSAAGAVIGAYAAGLAWLALPVGLAVALAAPQTPAQLAWLQAPVAWLARSSPWSLSAPREVWGPSASGPAALTWMVPEMAALQLGFGLALFALAAWRLRPVYRAQFGAGPARRRTWLGRALGLRPRLRPPCGDDPMRWKERSAPESGWLAQLVILMALAMIAFLLIAHQKFYHYSAAMDELFFYGLDLGPGAYHGAWRRILNDDLCQYASLLYTAALAAVAIVAAASVSGERARGTWTSLLATPLDRSEILRAKMFGAAWAVRVPLGMIALLYLVALGSTAMHPVGFVLGVVGLYTFVSFAIALGTYVSLRSRTPTQAITRTVMILLAINLGPALLIFPLVGWDNYAALLIFGCTPVFLYVSPMSWMVFTMLTQDFQHEPVMLLILAWVLGVVLVHALGAWFLTRAAFRRIDRHDVGA